MRKFYVIIVLLCNWWNLESQESIIPGSIDVLKTMITNSDADLYTGKISVEIPLYTYVDKDFELPISLRYISSGYKTHNPIGSTGLDWALNTGGYITRRINGIPDEQYAIYYTNKGAIWMYGWKYLRNFFYEKNKLYQIENGIVYKDARTRDYIYGIGINSENTKLIETTPDLFTFNFGKHKGNFMMNDLGYFSVFDTSEPEGEYKVEILNFGYIYPNDKVRIRITTGDGYKYTFEDASAESTNYMSFYFTRPLYQTYSTHYPLIEIEAPNGRKVIYKYNEKEWNTTSHFYYSKDADFNSPDDGTSDGIGSGFLTKAELISPISEIIIDNTIINFQYGEDRFEVVDIANRYHQWDKSPLPVVRMLEIMTVSNQDNAIKSFVFNYEYGKDLGYILSRQVPLLKSIDISGEGNYSMEYYHEDRPFPTLLKGRDYWGYWNNTNGIKELPKITNDLLTNVEVSTDNTYTPVFEFSLQGMLKALKYPTGGYSKYYYDPHNYKYKLVKDLRNNKQNKSYLEDVENETAGGVRVRRIANYASANDSTYSDYIYQLDDGKSSGILLHTPRFYREVNYLSNGYQERTRRISWLNDFIASEDNTHIAYSQVMKKNPDDSYTVYKFSDYSKYPDLFHKNNVTFKKFDITSSDLSFPDNFFAKNESNHRLRGKLLYRLDYDADRQLVYSEEYKYNTERFSSNLSEDEEYRYLSPHPAWNEFNIYVVDDAFSYFYIKKINTRSLQLDTVVSTTFPMNDHTSPIVKKTCFSYNIIGQLINKELILFDGNKISEKTQYPFDLMSYNGDQNVFDNMFHNGFRNNPVKIQKSISNKGIIETLVNTYNNIGNNESKFYRLSEIKKADITSPLLLPDFSENVNPLLKTEQLFTYDSFGNVKEKEDNRTGITTSYIWSYNHQYPIAEIKNASYSQISYFISHNINGMMLGNLIYQITSSSNPTDNMINNLSGILRESLPQAEVTTYTYTPLIGMTSTTNPRGITTYYEYDVFGRLKATYIGERDKFGIEKRKLVTSSYQYNYKE